MCVGKKPFLFTVKELHEAELKTASVLFLNVQVIVSIEMGFSLEKSLSCCRENTFQNLSLILVFL